jgi:hypothetical protein
MKRNEIALLVLIVGGVGLVTYFVLSSVLSGFATKPVEVQVATPITATLTWAPSSSGYLLKALTILPSR